MKYHVEEREESDLKASGDFIPSLLEKASLIVPSEWAVFLQMHLDNRRVGSWRGVPDFTKYGEKPSSRKHLITLIGVIWSHSKLSFYLCILVLF